MPAAHDTGDAPMIRLLPAFLTLTFLLAGCGSTPNTGSLGSDLSRETAAAVKSGMTKREVTALLGTPTNRTEGSEGREIWSYRYWREWSGTKWVHHPIAPGEVRPPDGSVYVWFLSTGRVGKVFRDMVRK